MSQTKIETAGMKRRAELIQNTLPTGWKFKYVSTAAHCCRIEIQTDLPDLNGRARYQPRFDEIKSAIKLAVKSEGEYSRIVVEFFGV